MSFEPSSCLKQFKLGFTTFLQSSLIQSLLVPAPGPRDLRVFMQSGAPVKRDSVGWSPRVRGSWALMFSFLCALNSLIAITKPLCVSVWHLRALRKILSVHFCGNKLGIYYNWSYAHKLCTPWLLPKSTESIMCVELYLHFNNSSELLLDKPHWLYLYCLITVAGSNARSILSCSSWCPDSLWAQCSARGSALHLLGVCCTQVSRSSR